MLLDTHVLLWLLTDDPRLGPSAREAIRDSPRVHASAASVWELAIKRSLGRLQLPDDLLDAVTASGVAWLPVTPVHAWSVGASPLDRGDPFDRLLLAQAVAERLPLVTADRQLLAVAAPGVRLVDARR